MTEHGLEHERQTSGIPAHSPRLTVRDLLVEGSDLAFSDTEHDRRDDQPRGTTYQERIAGAEQRPPRT